MSGFGYINDPQTKKEGGKTIDLMAKDYKFSDLKAKLGASASSGDVDLSPYSTPSNQFHLSSCVGNATADSVEILNAIAGYSPVQLSRLFVYAMARILSGDAKLEKDAGTWIRAAFEVLSKFGVCDEYLWPYLLDKVNDQPSLKAQRQAAGHRIHSYYRIDSSGDDRLEDIVKALHAKHPVVFGTTITDRFQKTLDRTPIPRPTSKDKSLGGHAMIIVGYINSYFLVKNSWGSHWGSNGFCLMTPEYISWSQTRDLWVPTLGVDFGAF